jgi:tetratricopeptide (TPR) repeat protein
VVVSAVRTWRSMRAEKVLLNALILICCIGLFLGGCGPHSGLYPESTLGTPEHHVFTGFALLRIERPDDAQREFEQALRLDPKCSGAYRGIGWVEGRKGDFSAAFASMTHAKEVAEKNEEKALVEVGFMALYTMQKGPDWVQRVEQSFTAACSLAEDLPEAYFELGIAYKQAYRFADAEKAFKKVIWIHGSLVSEAKDELELVRKSLRPGLSSPSTPE